MTPAPAPTETATPKDDAEGKVGFSERVAYASGDFASNFYWKLIDFFLLIFYTDVFGISVAAAGTMFLVTKVWDAINDPMMGAIADRTTTRFGKFRPYLLWGAIPLGVSGVLTFTTPDLNDSGKLIWAYVTYSLMMTAYTVINLPYSALLGVISPNTQERTTLASFRFIGAFSGGVVVSYFTPKLVTLFGAGNDMRGWQLTAAFWAVCAGALFVWTFLGTRERVSPPKDQTANVKQDVADLLNNRPWLVLLALALLVMLNMSIRNSVTAYYIKYFAGREDLMGEFITSGLIASLVGAATTPFWTKLWGKKKLFTILMSALVVLSFTFYLIPRDAIGLMFANSLLLAFALGPKAPLVFAMYADAADYAEWKFERRSTAFVFAAASFGQKLGGAIAGATIGAVLGAMGYVANQVQSESSLQGILLLMSVIPAAFAVLALIVVRLYPLGDDTLVRMREELAARKAG